MAPKKLLELGKGILFQAQGVKFLIESRDSFPELNPFCLVRLNWISVISNGEITSLSFDITAVTALMMDMTVLTQWNRIPDFSFLFRLQETNPIKRRRRERKKGKARQFRGSLKKRLHSRE